MMEGGIGSPLFIALVAVLVALVSVPTGFIALLAVISLANSLICGNSRRWVWYSSNSFITVVSPECFQQVKANSL